MKKIYLAVFLACSVGGAAHAQISEGGIPWSMSLQNEALASQKVARIDLPAPDYEQYHKMDEQDALEGAKPYRIAAMVPASINIQNSGTWSYLLNGSKVWRVEVVIPGAQALDIYYSKFSLPKGVKLFLSNSNKNQILGAYTTENQNQFGTFTNEEVQGSVATLELNVPAEVNIEDIALEIGKIGAGYRSYEYLTQRFGTVGSDKIVLRPTDASSTCHINANCPEGDMYPAWAKSKTATIQINMGGSVCSGTLLNHPGNVPGGACENLFLTASHCDNPNGRTDDHFADWKFRFNYQYVNCEGGPLFGYMQTTGATFKARSKFPSMSTPTNAAVSDFLLLKLSSVPAAADVYFAGWNREVDLTDEDKYPYFVGFHHPAGDPKKLARTTYVDPAGRFNQTSINATHWATTFSVGGTEGGSSGSGLFDIDGYLVGDLSGGQNPTGACAPMGRDALYSKLSYIWENEFDQAEFPGIGSRAKDFLDPAGTGITKWGPAKYNCSDAWTSISDMDEKLAAAVLVYPNPSNDGKVTVRVNFSQPTDFIVEVYDITGAKRSISNVSKVASGEMSVDLSHLSNGVYLVNVSAQGGSTSKKVVISK